MEVPSVCGLLAILGLLLSPPSWKSREKPPRLLSPVQGPFLGETVQKSPKSKGGERERAGTWPGLEGACFCNEEDLEEAGVILL